MAINLHILKASGKLEKLEEKIKDAFNGGLEKIQAKIILPSVDVVVDDDAQSTIPETGVGGFAPSAHILYIHLNPEFKDLENNLDFEIKSTLAHELCHCARWAVRGYGSTLLEALVSEGLADNFDIEVNNSSPKPWNTAIQQGELENLKQKAQKEFLYDEYDHKSWFFGSDEIPRWAGYSLGYMIVGEYLKRTNRKASEFIDKEAKLFIE